MNNSVMMTPCTEYDVQALKDILLRQMTDSGVIDKIHPGMKIALKLNLVAAMKPERGGTSHPAVIEALCCILQELGAEVILGDSPGGPFAAPILKNVYRACQIEDVAGRTGALLNCDYSQREVENPEALVAKNITVTNYLLEADAIINCAKLKTHGMMAMTATVKNMFGSIPGTMKPEYHFRFPTQEEFGNMLIDLQLFWKSKIIYHVLDGILGMEGNGPTAGAPRQVGVLLSGTNPYDIDLVGARIIGLEAEDVPTTALAAKRGLGKKTADDVDILLTKDRETAEISGSREDLSSFIIPDYDLIKKHEDIQFGGDSLFDKIKQKVMSFFLSSKPAPKRSECIGCKKCMEICPARAITMENNIPNIDRSKCIKCFCCQEFCPKGAMKVHRSMVAKLLSK